MKFMQAVISRYIKSGTQFSKYATTASVLNTLTWSTPSLEDYQILARCRNVVLIILMKCLPDPIYTCMCVYIYIIIGVLILNAARVSMQPGLLSMAMP